jgi:hypothetical protein
LLPDYKQVIEFKEFPCTVSFNPKLNISMSVIELANHCVVKASKHFFIRAMETVGETALYSKLQEISKFAKYLKHNVAEWHVQLVEPFIGIQGFSVSQDHYPQYSLNDLRVWHI